MEVTRSGTCQAVPIGILALVSIMAMVFVVACGGDEPTRSSVKVPDLICEDLQSAQDEVRPMGFYAKSHDAKGSRWRAWDRNWVVIRQTPRPGTMVPYGSTIDFAVVKHGETNKC